MEAPINRNEKYSDFLKIQKTRISREEYLEAIDLYLESLETIKRFQTQHENLNIPKKKLVMVRKSDLLIDIINNKELFNSRLSNALIKDITKNNKYLTPESTMEDLITKFYDGKIRNFRNIGRKTINELKLILETQVL